MAKKKKRKDVLEQVRKLSQEQVTLTASDREQFLRAEVARLRNELSQTHKLKGYYEVLSEEISGAIEALEPLKAKPYVSSGRLAESEMSAVIKLSDWHIGAVSKSQETEGFGEFNWSLAQERTQYIAQKFLGWVESHRRSFKIPRLYVLSEGDMVSGNIHYELDVTNEFPVPVQAVKAGGLLAQTIATFAPHFPEIHLSEINIDNHSRLTKKLQFAQGGENSWGYVVHAVANALLEKHKNVNLIEHKGIRGVVNINGVPVLTEHGHTVKAWNGIPWYGIERLRGKEASKRMTAFLEQAKREHKTLQNEIGFRYMSNGHWHVGSWTSGNILTNGCLPGTTEYDHAAGRYAPPGQMSFLMHPRHGIFDLTVWGVKR
jgi:hypothetical protein